MFCWSSCVVLTWVSGLFSLSFPLLLQVVLVSHSVLHFNEGYLLKPLLSISFKAIILNSAWFLKLADSQAFLCQTISNNFSPGHAGSITSCRQHWASLNTETKYELCHFMLALSNLCLQIYLHISGELVQVRIFTELKKKITKTKQSKGYSESREHFF